MKKRSSNKSIKSTNVDYATQVARQTPKPFGDQTAKPENYKPKQQENDQPLKHHGSL
jgi:hypothetical protein